jgi:hypothetical protein
MAAREAALGAMLGTTATAAGLELPVMQCTINKGDCVIIDSRLFHCGGSNTSGVRRRLVYFSLHAPGVLPPGGPTKSYSMLPQYKGKLRLERPPPALRSLDPGRLKLFAEYSQQQQQQQHLQPQQQQQHQQPQQQHQHQQASSAVQTASKSAPSLGGGGNLKASSAKKRKASTSLVPGLGPTSGLALDQQSDVAWPPD